MSETENKLFSKKDLRALGFTHRQIKELPTSGEVIKTQDRGRPAFGYRKADVEAAQQARA